MVAFFIEIIDLQVLEGLNCEINTIQLYFFYFLHFQFKKFCILVIY
jgi:hypothetical protein